MKIAVLGTGVVGQCHSERLSELGHDVYIGTRDVKQILSKTEVGKSGRPRFSEWHKAYPMIKLGTFQEAASGSDFIINATNGLATLSALEMAGQQNLDNKVLLDISNPLDHSKGFPPTLFVSNTDSLGEQIQRAFPGAHVVKSLNTMNANIQVNPNLLREDHHVFLSGNDEAAKAKVKTMLQSYGWKEKNIIDMGDISTARGTEQILPLWVRLYGSFKNPMFNFKIVKND